MNSLLHQHQRPLSHHRPHRRPHRCLLYLPSWIDDGRYCLWTAFCGLGRDGQGRGTYASGSPAPRCGWIRRWLRLDTRCERVISSLMADHGQTTGRLESVHMYRRTSRVECVRNKILYIGLWPMQGLTRTPPAYTISRYVCLNT